MDLLKLIKDFYTILQKGNFIEKVPELEELEKIADNIYDNENYNELKQYVKIGLNNNYINDLSKLLEQIKDLVSNEKNAG